MSQPSRPRLSWLSLLVQTILAVFAYVFMEWLFFASQPSFLDGLTLWKKLEVFMLAALLLTALAMPAQAVLRLLGLIPGPPQRAQVFQHIGALLPAGLFAGLTLLLLDNFAYALTQFGIIHSRGWARAGITLLFVGLLVYAYWQTLRSIRVSDRQGDWHEFLRWLAACLCAIGLVVGLMRVISAGSTAGDIKAQLNRTPHIILIGSDGLVANRMSLYGYQRETTPFLEQLAKTSLVGGNNWSNASATTGSVFSIMTGKYPATTRLLYSPDILHGENAYEHLPGILQRAGYRTVQIAFPYYVDADAVNLQDGFDEVNGRQHKRSDEPSAFVRRYHLETLGYFVPRLSERIIQRLEHIFFIRMMPDPYREMTRPVDPNSVPQWNDSQKVNDVLRLLRNAEQPTFVNVHLMGTHGEEFWPRHRKFSAGQKQSTSWMTDFYDDAVLDFDYLLQDLARGLERNDLLDKTIIIVYADHADQWVADRQVPLLIHFPRGEHARWIQANTQNLDIAPTLLDYLGMSAPNWMVGQSLLSVDPPANRPIISATVVDVDCSPPDWWCVVDKRVARPPFYQFQSMQVVICEQRYILYLKNNFLDTQWVKGDPLICTDSELADREQVREIVRRHLEANGFDASSLKK